jgi:hypothetical protein
MVAIPSAAGKPAARREFGGKRKEGDHRLGAPEAGGAAGRAGLGVPPTSRSLSEGVGSIQIKRITNSVR